MEHICGGQLAQEVETDSRRVQYGFVPAIRCLAQLLLASVLLLLVAVGVSHASCFLVRHGNDMGRDTGST